MDFPRIDSAMETCSLHLTTLAGLNPAVLAELERHLVAALTVLIVSEYEAFIEDSFGRRADRCGDPHVARYVRSQMARRFRSPDLTKVNDVLLLFGRDYRDSFFQEIENTQEHLAWDNIMRARHSIVHGQGAMNLTLRELRVSYARTRTVLERLVATLEA